MTDLVSNLFLWLWAAAAASAWLGTRGRARERRWAAGLLAGLWLLSTRPVAETFLRPLEGGPAAPSLEELRARGVLQVVVLTGGGYGVEGGLLSSAFPQASAQRFLGGLELCGKLGPECRLIFSGSAGRGRGELATALAMRDLAALVRPAGTVAGEAQSHSTREHPEKVRPLLAPGPFALVTSAFHMGRALGAFRAAGLDPVAFPVGRLARGGYGLADVTPSVESLWVAGVALREYQARALYALR